MNDRMRVLSVLSSSNQMYSGIGRAVFELSARLADRVDFTFVIDDIHPANVDRVQTFCDEHDFALHVGRGVKRAETLDYGNEDLGLVLRTSAWDAVECVCWANAATNEALLRDIGDAALIYTPHDQPSWTVPMSAVQAGFTEAVHRAVIRRADRVLCDSTWERGEIRRRAADLNNTAFVPLGCTFREFAPGPLDRKPQLVFVGDLAEPRKRFDRVVGVMDRLRRSRPDLRLVVIGNRSEHAGDFLPETLRGACDLRGYVSEAELRATYAESAGLILLSEFEAFGIPILESLACGTPAFLTEMSPTRSLFGGCRAAHFCDADDLDATANAVSGVLDRGRSAVAEAIADRPRLEARFDWDGLAEIKWRAIAAAWSRRNAWACRAS